MKKHISTALHVIFLIASLSIIFQALGDFDDAKNWLGVFKALFWLIIGSASFWHSVEGLATNKLWWKL